MKNVVIFDVENVMFNVKNVVKWLKGSDERMEGMNGYGRMEEMKRREEYLRGSVVKCRMFEGVGEEMERLMGLRRKMGGRLKVFVVSGFRKELVLRLLEVNGIDVDGVYGDVGKLMDDRRFDEGNVVYFCGDEKRWCRGELKGVWSVYCKWWDKIGDVGMESIDGMWKEIGVKVGGVEVGNNGECAVVEDESGSEVKLNKENVGLYKDIEVVGRIYRHPGGMSAGAGNVWMMDSDGRDIGFNVVEDGMDLEDVVKVIPSLAVDGLFSVYHYLGMGDSLVVDLYRWREYERRNLPVREDSCYEGWRSTVKEMMEWRAA